MSHFNRKKYPVDPFFLYQDKIKYPNKRGFDTVRNLHIITLVKEVGTNTF
jgi:hypothetical protein